MHHDDPNIDPVHGKRKEILHKLSPYYRVVNLNDGKGWRPVHIEKLPDPTMGRPVSKDTLDRYIQALQK
jgi:hypothetical protein